MKHITYYLLLIAALMLAAPSYAETTSNNPSSQETAAFEQVELSASLYTNLDSMNYYLALAAKEDAHALFVMACSYHFAQGHVVPEGVPYIRTRAQSDELLRRAADRNYEPAIRLIRCLEANCPVRINGVQR